VIEYRRIRVSDVGPIADLAFESMPKDDRLRVSKEKVWRWVTMFATSYEHFQLAAFEDGVAVAGIAAYVSEMPFYERQEATIMFCYAKVPGTGFRLLRALMRFVNESMLIRRVQWAQNTFDERIVRLARRLGFTESHPVLMFHKG